MQMAKIHTPHRKAGYLAGVEFEATTDREGRPDWTMVYEPGPKAQAEHLAFTSKGGPVARKLEPPLAGAKPPEVEPEPTGLERELVERGVTQGVAADLVRDLSEDRIRRQIEVLDWLRETKPKRVKDLGAYLARAIREDYAVPAGFEGRAERAAREAAERAATEREAEVRRSKARVQEERDRIKAFLASLTPKERAALDAEALAGAAPADRAAYEGYRPDSCENML